jgi:mannose-6-phosphate isomerase-like protein (cupin superfamily)
MSEIYFVISGHLQFKLEDAVLDLDGGTAVRVAPGVVRSVWNDGPEPAEVGDLLGQARGPDGRR